MTDAGIVYMRCERARCEMCERLVFHGTAPVDRAIAHWLCAYSTRLVVVKHVELYVRPRARRRRAFNLESSAEQKFVDVLRTHTLHLGWQVRNDACETRAGPIGKHTSRFLAANRVCTTDTRRSLARAAECTLPHPTLPPRALGRSPASPHAHQGRDVSSTS